MVLCPCFHQLQVAMFQGKGQSKTADDPSGRNIWKLHVTAMALQRTLQKVLLHFFHATCPAATLATSDQALWMEHAVAGDLANCNVSINEEAGSEGVPVSLVLDAGGAKVLADDVEVQPAHGRYLQGSKQI